MRMTSHAVTFFFVQALWLFTSLLSFSLKNCTIESSEKVVEVMCQSRQLQEIPTDLPQSSVVLDISFNKISQIKVTDFKHLSQLATLGVTHNQLFHIEGNAFGDLKELKILRLSQNKLTNLTANMFVGLDKLVALDLLHNHISKISPEAFKPLLNLQRVILNYNYIDNLTDTATLFKLPNIYKISLRNNQLTSFDSDELSLNTSKVTSLTFYALQKFSLKQDIFPYLGSIEIPSTKNLQWNVANITFLRNVTKLSLGTDLDLNTFIAMLHSTINLQKLTLTSMSQKTIKSVVQFACSKVSIKSLSLTYNILGTIDEQMMHCCTNVTELHLSSNEIKELSDQSLKSMTELQVLDLSLNNLHKVPLTIRRLSSLESLNLGYNYISEINCFDFANLTKLTTLILRKNHIGNLDECVFQNLYSLHTLDIGKNSVRSFKNAFRVNMSKLEVLLFTNNVDRFTLQQGEFRNLSSLRVLNLKSAKYLYSEDGAFEGLNCLLNLICSTSVITKMFLAGLHSLNYLELHLSSFFSNERTQNSTSEPPFSGLPNLKQLLLFADTKFSPDLSPDIFSGLKNLEYLKTDNFFRVSIYPDTFRYTPQLTRLDITNSDLSVLTPEVFYPIPKLQQLDLSNNKFSTLNFLANIGTLQMLTVSDNHLSVINETIFQTLPALTYLDISKNMLLCDCLNAGFQQWALSNNQTQVVNGYQYKCVSPVTQKEQKFVDFDTRSCWIDVGFICFISTSCLILLFLTACFVFHFLRFQVVYAYYLFLAYLYDTKSRRRGAGHHYDAFISYNVHDEEWVYNEMVPALEGEQGWRLCLHHRDFEPGKPIVENITDAIYSSRKTICVISRHYLQSEWCSREIQMASVRLFDEKKDVLILVFLEDIPTWQLSPYYQMRRVVKKRTYLSWPQAAQHKGVFWQKINQALNSDSDPNDNKHLIVEPENA